MYVHRFICTNTPPKQPLMTSHPSYSMYVACNDHNFNCVYLTYDKIKFYGSFWVLYKNIKDLMDRVKRIWYLSPMRAAKVQASLRIRAVSPEPSLLAHTSSESRGTRQKARSLAPSEWLGMRSWNLS